MGRMIRIRWQSTRNSFLPRHARVNRDPSRRLRPASSHPSKRRRTVEMRRGEKPRDETRIPSSGLKRGVSCDSRQSSGGVSGELEVCSWCASETARRGDGGGGKAEGGGGRRRHRRRPPRQDHGARRRRRPPRPVSPSLSLAALVPFSRPPRV